MQDSTGYFDLQVNGFAGVDFNADGLSADSFQRACQALRDDGAAGFLPTIITADLAAMERRLANLVELRRQLPLAQEMVLGFHIEGPFISPEAGFVGAHPVQHVRSANLAELKRLLDAAEGLTKIVTLAPECDTELRLTGYLAEQQIVVSAGHCNPSFEQLNAAIDAGLKMFTHLGNGCVAQVDRHDNIIQRTLSCADKLWISFIADGLHVPLFALKNYLCAAGIGHCIVVSDAISAAGLGPGSYPVGEQTIYVDEQRRTHTDGGKYLAGSATSISLMADHLRDDLGLSDSDVSQLTTIGPRAIIASTE